MALRGYGWTPISVWLGRIIFWLLCLGGLAAGGFLLLWQLEVIGPETFAGQEAQEEGAAVSAAPEPETDAPFRGVFLPWEDLDRAAEVSAGYDGVVVSMKAPDGALGYVSVLPQAAAWGTSFGDLGRNDTLRAMNNTPGLYTVAQVACLRDGAVVEADPSLALHRVSGSAWLDDSGLGWLDPAREEVRSYLIGVCRELAQLGFDEILLTDCAYPQEGQGVPRQETADPAEALTTFCRRLRGALAEYDVALSLQGVGDYGPDAASGQTAALLASADRVWAAPTEETALAAFHPAILPEG